MSILPRNFEQKSLARDSTWNSTLGHPLAYTPKEGGLYRLLKMIVVPWEVILSSTTFQLALVNEFSAGAPPFSPDDDVPAEADDPNEGQDAEMDEQQRSIARELERRPMSSHSRISLQWMGRAAWCKPSGTSSTRRGAWRAGGMPPCWWRS